MGGDGLTDHWADTGDQVEHTGWEAQLIDYFGQHEGVQRCDLAGLEHHCAANGHGWGNLRHDLV